ncbi:MAG: hypothetical protein Kow00109_13220 [Acidobacteriota bacterium]
MYAKNKIVSIGPLPSFVMDRLGEFGEVVCVPDASRQATLEVLDDSVILLIPRGSVLVDAEILDRVPRLVGIARTGVGYDTVDIAAATKRRIPVLYTPGAMTGAVAEHTLALMLAAVKRLSFWRDRLLAEDWEARYRERSGDLEGTTVGIIGYGRIGRRVRQLLRPFACPVLADDPYIDHEQFRNDEVEFVDLETILRRSRILTLHVPLTEETRGMIHRGNLPLLPEGAVLVNTARGAVIESLDLLVEALDSGRLGAVALDVFPEEPPPWDHPILRHPRAFLTGHVAARSPLAQKRILETMLEDVIALLSGGRPRRDNVVNPEVWDDEEAGR